MLKETQSMLSTGFFRAFIRMFKKLKLKQKFTLSLLLILIGGVALSGLALSSVLRKNAQNEVTSTALLLMETMNSVREYTSSQVKPELVDQLEERFLPETVPAYSARGSVRIFAREFKI